jgi:hypothetical protein
VGTVAKARFEVTSHLELSGRGAFVVGHIRDGVFRIGMKVLTHEEPASLTISAIEYVDNVGKGGFWNALMFREDPPLGFLQRVFPVGALLEAE